MVIKERHQVNDSVVEIKTVYCNYCGGELLKIKRVKFNVYKQIEEIEILENVYCKNCSRVNKVIQIS